MVTSLSPWAAADGCTRATIGFRPEAIRLVGEGEGFPFEVVLVEELGSDAYAYGTLHASAASQDDKLMTIRVDARQVPRKGETVHLDIPSEEAHVFSADSGRRMSGDTGAAQVASGSGGSTRLPR